MTGLSSIADLASSVINRIWPDATESDKAKLTLALAQLNDELESRKAQSAVNQVEAGSGSLFVSGWRPFVGWICGLGLAFQFILSPIISWSAALFHYPVSLPPLDSNTLMTLLLGLLGLSAARTVEKLNGVASK